MMGSIKIKLFKIWMLNSRKGLMKTLLCFNLEIKYIKKNKSKTNKLFD